MNRETKRMMQRQGAVAPDGTPTRRTTAPAGGSGGEGGDGGGGQRFGRPPVPGTDRRNLPERGVEYMREVRGELQKVAWPGRSEVFNYTVVVLVAVVLLTLFVFGLDYGFARAIFNLFPIIHK